MTEYEICREYRLAKRPKVQIGILADMTCKSREEIKEILYRGSLKDKRIKVSRPAAHRYGFAWTEELDNMLRLLRARGFTREKMADFLDLSVSQVSNRITQLKKEGTADVQRVQAF